MDRFVIGLFFLLGFLLSFAGFSVFTIEYWVIMVALAFLYSYKFRRNEKI